MHKKVICTVHGNECAITGNNDCCIVCKDELKSKCLAEKKICTHACDNRCTEKKQHVMVIYENPQEAFEQLEFCNYTDAIGHMLENNTAYIAIKNWLLGKENENGK